MCGFNIQEMPCVVVWCDESIAMLYDMLVVYLQRVSVKDLDRTVEKRDSQQPLVRTVAHAQHVLI